MDANQHAAVAQSIMLRGCPTHCTECGSKLEAEERGQYLCGLCFPITPSMERYLAAFDRWMADGFGLAERSAALRVLVTDARNGD